MTCRIGSKPEIRTQSERRKILYALLARLLDWIYLAHLMEPIKLGAITVDPTEHPCTDETVANTVDLYGLFSPS